MLMLMLINLQWNKNWIAFSLVLTRLIHSTFHLLIALFHFRTHFLLASNERGSLAFRRQKVQSVIRFYTFLLQKYTARETRFEWIFFWKLPSRCISNIWMKSWRVYIIRSKVDCFLLCVVSKSTGKVRKIDSNPDLVPILIQEDIFLCLKWCLPLFFFVSDLCPIRLMLNMSLKKGKELEVYKHSWCRIEIVHVPSVQSRPLVLLAFDQSFLFQTCESSIWC